MLEKHSERHSIHLEVMLLVLGNNTTTMCFITN